MHKWPGSSSAYLKFLDYQYMSKNSANFIITFLLMVTSRQLAELVILHSLYLNFKKYPMSFLIHFKQW